MTFLPYRHVITTKYLPATDTLPGRIRATIHHEGCRSNYILNGYSNLNPSVSHKLAATYLCIKVGIKPRFHSYGLLPCGTGYAFMLKKGAY